MPEVLVIMPFGRRAYLHGQVSRVTDLDLLYEKVIRPSIGASGNTALRIDEVVDSGSITSQYLSWIVSTDVVVADLSMPNGNVYYELGIRPVPQ